MPMKDAGAAGAVELGLAPDPTAAARPAPAAQAGAKKRPRIDFGAPSGRTPSQNWALGASPSIANETCYTMRAREFLGNFISR